ncbi:hypothetical protein [Paenibacillus sp. Soil724D2]|uniref:hypothetical protein n=1 Tax=Paenibacillus sp. (strain Soil724D2) TaxID=1736392 RepID=UPI0007162C5F|nr:hypothetical protein [Paenibacillus sp. Soil724D2]KRE33414.1 hypothetical protein ASG85_14185 [Paenibacillus sp. Soil724D2]
MWKVTYDWLDKVKMDKESYDWDQKKWDALPPEQKTKIKLYDDDNNLYYDGVTSDIDEDEDKAFAPLNWAERNAGCTYMKYKNEKGEWVVL